MTHYTNRNKVFKEKELTLEPKEITTALATGTLFFADRAEEIEKMPWIPHPKFKGAFMKHLVKGVDNDNLASCHLVRVNPGCQLDDHIHVNEWEYHHILEGNGTGYLDGQSMAYEPGKIAVIPKGANHKVVAGQDGILILATFLPALL
jgi:quercetin dioxygenase-like cupin family protein